ncbi:MAG TPA: NAD(P)/FAD-dependent oxidoreductase [Nocardioides sp.]|nr:NAD(P)/FAD-dependent oxidoreductase [Nocardioides sp.]
MSTVDTVVIGAGHAGLATSRLLTQAGRDHVVLERGRVGERWRSERWDSLRLLTPSWMLTLPGSRYGGPDPDSFLPAATFVEMLVEYAASFAAPVVDGTTVEEVRASGRGASRYLVTTDAGTWHARHLVLATGPHGVPVMPAGLEHADLGPASVLAARDYRNPAQLAPGGVLVVGASASGVQIAEELQRAGRQVTLAVGRHSRLPRSYRGFDVFWWLESTGRLARTLDDTARPDVARREPSLQLVGRHHGVRPGSHVDLAALQHRGVRVAGRLLEVSAGVARFADDLPERIAVAEAGMHRVLDAADAYAQQAGLVAEIWPPERPPPVPVPPRPPAAVDLRAEGITTVVVAAGYRPHHPWLRLPVVGSDGRIDQRRGVTAAPGVYTVGQRFQHRRDSAFIGGARHDAAHVVELIAGVADAPSLSTEEVA